MQEKLFKEYKTTKYNQMLYINSFSALVSFMSILGGGGFGDAFGFFSAHPAIIADAGLLSITAVTGQAFNYSLVQDFGALVFAATMNLRQVASILTSYAVYGHHMAPLQAAGLALVFSALLYKSYRNAYGHDVAGGRLLAERRRLMLASGEEKSALKLSYNSASTSQV
mmetsp:Transcript_26581/g.53116  ORF Transcript_26581/g.53116 Transcript_26581/m.53116 type:complete len:168 (-) Transcript_26581:57-560(-)